MKCKKCSSEAYHKDWFIRGLQRYKCKECWCCFTNTPTRKAPMKVKLDALRLYTLWLWFRAIGRFLGYSNVAILKRIREFGALAERIHEEQKQEKRIVEVIELDELWHYTKKNTVNFEYGRLCLENEDLLILPSEIVQQKQGSNYEKS